MITIYTMDNCNFCVLAKEILKESDIEFNEINIQEDKEALGFLREEGHRTVPQIYKNNNIFVKDGYNGLLRFDTSVLKEMSE